MEMDWDLCRKILLRVEELHQAGNPWIESFKLSSDVDSENLSEHVRLLDEACLLEAHDLSSKTEYCWVPIRLTFEGHEFVNKSRDQQVWEAAFNAVLKRAGSTSFDLLIHKLTDIGFGRLASNT